MPAAIIHESIAIKALEKIKNVPQYIKDNINALKIGAQGPDLLFFYHILKFWEKDFVPNNLGEEMHQHKSSAFFRSVLPKAKKQGNAARAWFTGFVAHYAADATIHPYVYARTNNEDGSQNTTKHLVLEEQFDTWYHRHILGKKRIPRQGKFLKSLTDIQKKEMSAVLAESCSEVYPESKLTAKQVYSCFSDMNIVISTLYSPYKIKHIGFRIIERLIGKPDIVTRHAPAQKLPNSDFMNLKKDLWLNPWETSIESHNSFPELFDLSVSAAKKYIVCVIDYYESKISLDEVLSVLGNKSFSSGLELADSI